MPDFDKMWEKIKDRMDNPIVYFIENINSGMWLAEYEDIHYQTIYPAFAMKFVGEKGKEEATFYLWFNQERNLLKGFRIAAYISFNGPDSKCVSPAYYGF